MRALLGREGVMGERGGCWGREEDIGERGDCWGERGLLGREDGLGEERV